MLGPQYSIILKATRTYPGTLLYPLQSPLPYIMKEWR